MCRRSRLSIAPQRDCAVAGRCAAVQAGGIWRTMNGKQKGFAIRSIRLPLPKCHSFGLEVLYGPVWGIKGADLCKDLLSLNRLEPVSGCIKYGWKVGADSLSRLPRRESQACRRDFNDHRYSQADLHVSTSTMSRPWDLPPRFLMASPGTAGQCHGNVGRRELLLEAIRRLDPTGFWVLEESEVS
jgi:hypothetical protein